MSATRIAASNAAKSSTDRTNATRTTEPGEGASFQTILEHSNNERAAIEEKRHQSDDPAAAALANSLFAPPFAPTISASATNAGVARHAPSTLAHHAPTGLRADPTSTDPSTRLIALRDDSALESADEPGSARGHATEPRTLADTTAHVRESGHPGNKPAPRATSDSVPSSPQPIETTPRPASNEASNLASALASVAIRPETGTSPEGRAPITPPPGRPPARPVPGEPPAGNGRDLGGRPSESLRSSAMHGDRPKERLGPTAKPMAMSPVTPGQILAERASELPAPESRQLSSTVARQVSHHAKARSTLAAEGGSVGQVQTTVAGQGLSGLDLVTTNGALLTALSAPALGLDGTHSIQVVLNPPELGQLSATIRVQGERTEVVFVAETEAGHRVISANLDLLKTHLRSGGTIDASVRGPTAMNRSRKNAGGNKEPAQIERRAGMPFQPAERNDNPNQIDLVL